MAEISNLYQNCYLCHRACGINRTIQTGYCKMPDTLSAARAALHFWEEPCISGDAGSGTVFFSGCSLRCVYCQNHSIAAGSIGKQISTNRLAEIFLELQEKGAVNINLVTPTHFIPSIISALDTARQQGLSLPVVYNTGNYETIDALKALEGYVDIYLPDFKYWSSELSKMYSNAPDYAVHACENIAEMYRQTGEPVFAPAKNNISALPNFILNNSYTPAKADIQIRTHDNINTASYDESEHSLMKRGVIVRHLALPGALSDSKQILRYLYGTYQNHIYLSIMNQYTPLSENLHDYPELNRRITKKEYNKLIDYALELGIEKAFIQEGETAAESFIPVFNNKGI